MTRKEEARILGSYVMSKIRPLQNSYLGSGAGAASARASLARLRRLDGATGTAWVASGELLFDGWPEKEVGSPEKNQKALNAVRAALMLYAIHQQAESTGMALVGRDGGSFGRACREIEPDRDKAKGVQRRLSVIESASDFEGVVRGMRSLVQLMKGKNKVKLDYWCLSRDLYLIQFPYERDAVLSRWGWDYWSYEPANVEQQSNKN